MSVEYRPRETLPRRAGGIDYGAERRVIARSPDRSIVLWWRRSAKLWSSVGMSDTYPGELVLARNPNRSTGYDTIVLHSGGRLSAKLLARHAGEVADAFGVDSIDLHPRRTIVVSPKSR